MTKPIRANVQADQFRRYKWLDMIPLHKFSDTKKLRNGRVVKTGKAPLDFTWTTRTYKGVIARCATENRNMGWRIPAAAMVIDVDPRNGGNEGFADLVMEYGIDESKFPRVDTGSGGFHLYGKKPAGLTIVDTLEAYPGVEFKSKGRQVVAAGSIHPDTLKAYTFSDDHPAIEDGLPEFPAELLQAITRPERSGEAVGGGQYTQEQLARALAKLDAEDFRDYSAWLQLAMACHHATNGDGREVFIEWSTQDAKYADDGEVIGRKWDGFHSNHNAGVTYKTLNMILAQHGAANETVAADDAGDDFEGEPVELNASDDDGFDFEEGEEQSDGSWHPKWDKTRLAPLKDWNFIIGSYQFVHEDGVRTMDVKQFEMSFGKLSPKGKIIYKIERGLYPMKRWAAQVYIPLEKPILTYRGPPAMPFEGRTVFNLWRESGIKPKAGDHQWFLDHVAKLFPNDEQSRALLLDYMAQLVQHPNVKIHFALLIQSIEGAGKGAIGRILRRGIGDRNTVEPSNDEAVKTWTGWQEGAQLAIINELYAAGDTAVMNRLKSPIADDKLRIEKKFGHTFSLPNYLNFICFSNHKDALKLTPTDRRWLVLFSRWQPGPDDKAYYDSLFESIADDDKIAAVLAFLLDRKISFNPKGHAPQTDAKAEMIERARTDHAVELDDQWTAQRPPFDHAVIRLEDIVDYLKATGVRDKNLAAVAGEFLDKIKARRLRRYTKGGTALPAYQLYAIREHDKWDAASPKSVAAAYHERHTAADDVDDDATPFG